MNTFWKSVKLNIVGLQMAVQSATFKAEKVCISSFDGNDVTLMRRNTGGNEQRSTPAAFS